MKKFFKVVPSSSSKPLGVGTNNVQSNSGSAKQLKPANEKINKFVRDEKKKRKIGLDDDIFDTDATMDECSENATPAEEIVISDDEADK